MFVSAAGHGYELDSGAVVRDSRSASLPPIVNIVLAIAAATIWLVALPAALDKPAPDRACEAAILVDGEVECVVDWLVGAKPVRDVKASRVVRASTGAPMSTQHPARNAA